MTALTQALLYAHEYSSALSGNTFALGRLSHQSLLVQESARARGGCRGLDVFPIERQIQLSAAVAVVWGLEGYNNSIYCSLALSGSACQPISPPPATPPTMLLSGRMDWAILENSSFRVITISESCFCPVRRRRCLETFDLVLSVSAGTLTRMVNSFGINCRNGRDMVGMTARSRLYNRSNLPRRTEDLAGVLGFLLGLLA